MRIVVLITVGIDRPSGTRYFNIARELVRSGHRVRVLALHPDLASCEERRFVRDGVEVWYVGQMHARKRGTQPERFGPLELLCVLIASTLGMIWGIICSPADVYHLGKPQPINGLAALLGVVALRRQRFYVDCDDDEVASNRLTAGWQRAVFAFWQWLLPRCAAAVTVNTHFLEYKVRTAGVTNVVHVPNGVDLQRWQKPDPGVVDGLKTALGLNDRCIIAYVGTIALQNHPVDLLLDAFAQLASRRSNLHLLLVGGGEDVALMRERTRQRDLEDRIFFAGHLPQATTSALLTMACLSVDPVHDNDVARARSPLKLFESLALGVPVVTGNVGDRAALLADGRAGVLVPPADVSALAEGIDRIIGDGALRQAMAVEGLAHVQQYSWRELARRWETVYDQT